MAQSGLHKHIVGQGYEIAWGAGHKQIERKALQWMLEQMGGLQFRHFSLTSEKKRSASAAALGNTTSEDDQDAGWDFIIKHGERDRGQLKQLRWIHKHIGKEGSPIKGWSEKLVQKALDSLANEGCLAKLTTRYDLTIHDFHPTFLDTIFKVLVPHLADHSLWLLGEPGVGKTPLARVTAMMFSRYHGGEGCFRSSSDFDFFRGIFFDKTIPAVYDDGDICVESVKKKKAFADVGDEEGMLRERWNAAKFVKGQARIVVDNAYVALEVPLDASDISHEDIVKMIRPVLGYISDTDTRAILKRGCFIVFTKDSIYFRPPSQHEKSVSRQKWALRDILLDDCKHRFNNYKKNGPPPVDFPARAAAEKAWLEGVLQEHDSNHTVEEHFTNTLPQFVVKMEAEEFSEAHEGLAAMCDGVALDADSPPPEIGPAPMTHEATVKKEKFDQEYASFLLRSNTFSKSLGPNAVLELSPTSSCKGASQNTSSPPPAVASTSLGPHALDSSPIPNPDFLSEEDLMDVATESEPDVFEHGKRRAALKKPAAKNTYEAVPYVRHGQVSTKFRAHRQRWGYSIQGFMSMNYRDLVRTLQKENILPNWTQKQCPRCGYGKLGKLKYVKCRKAWLHQCSSRTCHKYLQPHDFHPIFFQGSGNSHTSLNVQASILYAAVAGVPVNSTHLVLDTDHKPIERIFKNLDVARAMYVDKEEKSITYGGTRNSIWKDVEADEVDVGKAVDEAALDARQVYNIKLPNKTILKVKSGIMLEKLCR
ncbi:hypothetical protein AK812_SmicGene15849 [Symbiodinium microadriaticum]|uniref:Uncharacterized protein n=1 Tax=Symbiodinium microadriaticum TaxID=2951 RepID=A0A1Q9E1W9_SYMMI|nr:hypothetical protein AK812_SmicGene15849 [Symbiodinium microadriaticum]